MCYLKSTTEAEERNNGQEAETDASRRGSAGGIPGSAEDVGGRSGQKLWPASHPHRTDRQRTDRHYSRYRASAGQGARHDSAALAQSAERLRHSDCQTRPWQGSRAHRDRKQAKSGLGAAYADFLTALSTSVLPSDQIAPGTLWLPAMTASNAVSIHLQSSSVIVSEGNSLMVWLPWPATCVRIL